MEFEDMQIIWNNQNQEKLYAINEAALHTQIKRKGKSISRNLDIVEMMMIWYLLPLMLVAGLISAFNSNLLWAIGLIGVVAPLACFGGRWEINKFYLPKKHSLASLHEKLLAPEPLGKDNH